jgi:hypothetical protein
MQSEQPDIARIAKRLQSSDIENRDVKKFGIGILKDSEYYVTIGIWNSSSVFV